MAKPDLVSRDHRRPPSARRSANRAAISRTNSPFNMVSAWVGCVVANRTAQVESVSATSNRARIGVVSNERFTLM